MEYDIIADKLNVLHFISTSYWLCIAVNEKLVLQTSIPNDVREALLEHEIIEYH